MKVAAVIFAVAGLAYLAWDVVLIASGGGPIGSLLMAILAAALLAQSYELFRARPRARMHALISAGALSLGAAGVAAILVSTSWPITSMPAQGWVLLGMPIGLMLVFGIAFGVLLADKHAV